MPGTDKLICFYAAADLLAALEDWQRWLTAERRTSRHTVDAYCRDVASFLEFIRDHSGETADLAILAALTPADFRALARRAAESRTVPHLHHPRMSALRNLFRFLDRTGRVDNQALSAVKAPKPPKSVPKPLNADDALALLRRAMEIAPAPWIGARDVAILTLLYGCGLRIDEALSLNQGDAPSGDTMMIMGKGNKERIVPCCPS